MVSTTGKRQLDTREHFLCKLKTQLKRSGKLKKERVNPQQSVYIDRKQCWPKQATVFHSNQ